MKGLKQLALMTVFAILLNAAAASGTEMTMSLQGDKSDIPWNYRITAEDMDTGQKTDLRAADYKFTVSSGKLLKYFKVTAFTDTSALSDMNAVIKVSGGGTYDYFIIGMRGDATDGFDNAFDTVSPGTLNDTYILTYMPHPEWGDIATNFRGDIRSLGNVQEWSVAVYTNMAAVYRVSGVVEDETGNPIAGAKVMLSGFSGMTYSGADGGFVFADIPPGSYLVKASYKGYKFNPAGVVVTDSDVDTRLRGVLSQWNMR